MVSAANDEEVIESHSGDSYPSMMRGSSSALTLQAEVEEEALYTCWGISIIARRHKGLTQLKMDDALNPRCGKWLLSLAFPVDSSPLIFEKKISTPNPCSFLTAKGIYNFLQKKKKKCVCWSKILFHTANHLSILGHTFSGPATFPGPLDHSLHCPCQILNVVYSNCFRKWQSITTTKSRSSMPEKFWSSFLMITYLPKPWFFNCKWS